MDEERKVNEFDYIKGRLVYINNKNIKKETDLDFFITREENREKLFDLIKVFDLGENLVVDTSMPLGKSIFGKLINTTFIVDGSKFYIDEIKSIKEIVEGKEKNKWKFDNLSFFWYYL